MNDLSEEQAIRQELAALIEEPVRGIHGLRRNLEQIKKIKDRVEFRKREITMPAWKAYKSAMELFKPIEDTIKEAETYIKHEILSFESKRVQAQTKLVAQVASGRISVDQSLSVMSQQEKGLFRDVKRIKITSKKDIPDKYWIIDEIKLRADLIAGKKVKGATLIEEKTVVSR